MNVAGYVRVSTEQQREEGSHERQREQLEEWAERNGHDLVAPGVDDYVYEDVAISGQSDDRPAYETMMDHLDEFDAVAVRELSRFGRSLRRVLRDVETLQEHDVGFVSVTEDFDTSSAMGEAMFQMIGVFNHFWANLARERASAEIERRREEGEPIGRPKKLDAEQRAQVAEWYDENDLGPSQIQALTEQMWGVDVSRDTIYRYAEEFAE